MVKEEPDLEDKFGNFLDFFTFLKQNANLSQSYPFIPDVIYYVYREIQKLVAYL